MGTAAWTDLEAARKTGGLGFGSIQVKNLGFLLKWWWIYCKDDDQLWKRVISSVHNLPNNFFTLDHLLKIKHGPLSEIYRASQKLPWFGSILKDAFQVRIGSGSILKFWEDIWIGSSSLAETFPRLFSISLQKSAYH